MEQKDGILKILNTIKEDMGKKSLDEINGTITSVQSILDRFFSRDSPYLKDLIVIRNNLHFFINYPKIDQKDQRLLKHQASYGRLLDSMILEIDELGLPSKNDITFDRSIKVNVNQHQAQEQSAQLAVVLEFIKDQLTGKQFKEIIEITKNEQNANLAKPKILEKLKGFGENVCSNIIANLITNPLIWDTLIH